MNKLSNFFRLNFIAQRKKWAEILVNSRLIAVLFLGFASGLPLALTGSTLQAWYAISHINIISVGTLSLVGQPYVYKFLWAPLLDRYRIPWLGRRRGWVFLLQALLVLSIATMGCMQPNDQPVGLAMVAVFVALLSASQDIGVDAYRTEILLSHERGLGIALSTMGYRIAMLVAGGGALVMADHWGWEPTYWLMAALMATQLIITYSAPEPVAAIKPPTHLMQAMLHPFKQFLKQHYAIPILIFIIIYKLGDAFSLVLSTTFLLRGAGFTLTDIGLIYKVVSMIGVFIGAAAGGLWMKRLSLLQALAIFGVIQAWANLPFLWLALGPKNYVLLILAVFTENLGSGLSSIAFLAFITALCDYRYTATQFALFSALAASGRVFVGPLAGLMVEHIGWAYFYVWAFLIGFPGVLMLGFIKRHPVFLTK